MSGHKKATITIDQAEYDRLRESDLQLRSLPEPKFGVIAQIQQESQEGIVLSLDRISERQENFRGLLQGFNEHVKNLELYTSQTLVNHQAFVQQQFDQRDGMIWESFLQLMEETSQHFSSQVLNEYYQNQAHLEKITNRLNRLMQVSEQKEKMANQWLVSAEEISDFINQHYHHHFFAPNQLNRYVQILNIARDNLENGMPEAAITSAQQVYRDLSEFRVNLEKLESEWQMLFCAAWEGLCHVHALTLENQVVKAVDLDGTWLDVDLEVDYWTKGRISDLFVEIDDLFTLLEDENHRPGISLLKELLKDKIPALRSCLQNAIYDARVAAINSQMRINIADLVVQSLQEQGFELERASYQHVDMRDAYYAQLACRDGSQVVVQVNPVGDGLGENELQLRSLDEKFRTEHELIQRWKEINNSLAVRGLSMQQAAVEGAALTLREGTAPSRQYKIKGQKKRENI